MQKILIGLILVFSFVWGGDFCTKKSSSAEIKKILRTQNDVDCMLILSSRYLKRGELSLGFYYLSLAYKISPTRVEADKSSKILNLALKLTKLEYNAKKHSNENLWNILGDEYFEMKAFAEAKRAYKNSLKIKPSQIKIRVSYAITLQALKKHYSAVIELKKVLMIDKQNIHANYYIGKILKNNIKDFKKAKKYFRFVIILLQKTKHNLKKAEKDFFVKDSKYELQSLKKIEN